MFASWSFLCIDTAKSKELDVEGNGKGVSESAILDNQEARV